MTIKKQVLVAAVLCSSLASSVRADPAQAPKWVQNAVDGFKMTAKGAAVIFAARVIAPLAGDVIRDALWAPNPHVNMRDVVLGDNNVVHRGKDAASDLMRYVRSFDAWRALPGDMRAAAEEDVWRFIVVVAFGAYIFGEGWYHFDLPGAEYVHNVSPCALGKKSIKHVRNNMHEGEKQPSFVTEADDATGRKGSDE